MRAVLAAMVAVGVGCGVSDSAGLEPEYEPEPIPILDPFDLVPVAAELDPLAEHRPDEVDCPPAAWGFEGNGFEIQTGVCEYAAFDQPLPMPVAAGDELDILIWHDLLDAAEPGDAHLAVWLGTTVVWEAEVAIPAPAGAFDVSIPITTTPPPDARLGLHLHNHGYNSWRFVAIDLHPR